MRKIVVSEFVSMDGVAENPKWTFQFGGEEQQMFKYDELKNSDALLLGRVTYEEFAGVWPNVIEQTGDYGVRMNEYPKYVVSNSLEEANWNNSTIVRGNLTDEIANLKQQPGKDILIFGSCGLVQSLMKLGLIDEYRLMIFPIVLGSGKRLFETGLDESVFKLTDSKTFSTGVVVLTYQKA